MIYLLIINLKTNFGQILEYPFNVDIWGTVSDWVMVLVTAITFYFLYQSFRQQQVLSNYERIKFNSLIKPSVVLELVHNFDMNQNSFSLSFNLICKKHKLFLDKIVIAPGMKITEEELIVINKEFFMDEDEILLFSYNVFKNCDVIKLPNMHSNIKVYFSDISGNKYVREFVINHFPLKILPQHTETYDNSIDEDKKLKKLLSSISSILNNSKSIID